MHPKRTEHAFRLRDGVGRYGGNDTTASSAADFPTAPKRLSCGSERKSRGRTPRKVKIQLRNCTIYQITHFSTSGCKIHQDMIENRSDPSVTCETPTEKPTVITGRTPSRGTDRVRSRLERVPCAERVHQEAPLRRMGALPPAPRGQGIQPCSAPACTKTRRLSR